jgi:hypothetical protein
MLTQLRLKQLHAYLESVAIKGIPISQSKHYPKILMICREILDAFGIPKIRKYEALLLRYVYNAEFTEHFMNDVLNYLTKMADKTLTGEIDDFKLSKNYINLTTREDLTEEQKENFERAIDEEWQEIEEQREKKMKALQSLPRTVEPEAVRLFLTENLEFPISDKELENILIGFQLFWKYSNPQKAGDLNFLWAVDQYLTSIESPMDRKKMEKVVDSILEYLQEIRLWGYPE